MKTEISFPEYLLTQGFKCFRKEYIDNKWIYKECEFRHDYSTMISGHLDYRFIRDGFEVSWGLHEQGKPATLCSPEMFMGYDDDINRWLADTPNEDILKTIMHK